MAGASLSSRAIAPIVGKSHMSVARDLASVTDVTDEAPAPREVHGRDGITRTFQPRPAPEPVTVKRDIGSGSFEPDAPRTVKSIDGVERTFGRHLDKFLSRTTPPPRWLAPAPARAARIRHVCRVCQCQRRSPRTGCTARRGHRGNCHDLQ